VSDLFSDLWKQNFLKKIRENAGKVTNNTQKCRLFMSEKLGRLSDFPSELHFGDYALVGTKNL